ncbi:MAG: TRAP transporter large permease [Nitrospinota bacterium]
MWLILIFLALLIFGVPIGFTMGITGLLYFLMGPDPSLFLTMIPERMFTGMDSFVLMAIPFFMLAGEIMNFSGISDRVIHFTNLLVGRFRGGLAHVNVASSMVFAGITGVAVGDVAALGSVFIPAMQKEGYDRGFSAAITASSSLVGPIIPPSIIIVIYGAVMEMSIGALFAAAIIPGIIMGLANSAAVHVLSIRRNYPKREVPVTIAEFVRGFYNASLSLLFPIIIVGGIVFGIFTPTEAAAVAVAYAFLLSRFFFRTLEMRRLHVAMLKALKTSARIFLIIACVSILSWVFANEEVPQKLMLFVRGLTGNKYILLLILNLFLLFLGTWMTGSAAIILFAPILQPLIMSYGIHPLQWSIIMIVNLVIGLITPPLGIVLFAVSDIAEMRFSQTVRAIFPLRMVDIGALMLITYYPPLTLTFPRVLGFI